MNWSALAAVVSTIGLLVTVIGVAWIGGRITQRVDDNTEAAGRNDAAHMVYDRRLAGHDMQLARIEEWKSGFAAGVNTHGMRDAPRHASVKTDT